MAPAGSEMKNPKFWSALESWRTKQQLRVESLEFTTESVLERKRVHWMEQGSGKDQHSQEKKEYFFLSLLILSRLEAYWLVPLTPSGVFSLQ